MLLRGQIDYILYDAASHLQSLNFMSKLYPVHLSDCGKRTHNLHVKGKSSDLYIVSTYHLYSC